MNNIQKYIAALVINHDCVIIPGLGAFIAQPTSADIHPITHKFSPPGRTIGFNAQIKVNDGLLASYIATAENISFQLANTRIEEFVKYFNENIHTYKLFNLKEVGRFFYNLEGKLEFEPDYNSDFSSDSFGLPDFVFKPIERNTFDMTQPSQPRKIKTTTDSKAPKKELSPEEISAKTRSSFGKVLMIVLPLFVLIGAAGYVVLNQQQDNALAGFNLFGGSSKKDVDVKADTLISANEIIDSAATIASAEADTAMMAAEQITEAAPVEENTAVVEKSSVETAKKIIKENKKQVAAAVAVSQIEAGKYYIIVGAFKNENNADNLVSKLLKEEKAVVKLPADAGGFYKVAYGAYDNQEAADAEMKSLEATHSGLWIKKY